MNISPLQPFKTQMEFDRFFATEEACINFFVNLRWQGKPKCPKCGHDAGSFSDGKHFKCKNNQCNKVFSYKAGTILENHKVSMQELFKAIYLMLQNNVSSHTLLEDIGVTQVKADEATFDGASGSNRNRHSHKKISRNTGTFPQRKNHLLNTFQS